MKAFEKWYLPDKDIYPNEYEMQKTAWRAALEWFNKCLIEEATYPNGTSGHDLAEDLKEIINTELEDK